MTVSEGCLSLPEHYADVDAARPRSACAISTTRTRSARSRPRGCWRPASSTRSTISTACCSSTTSRSLKRGIILRKLAKTKRRRPSSRPDGRGTGRRCCQELVLRPRLHGHAAISPRGSSRRCSRPGINIVAVYSQPPRPAGRGHRLQPAPVQRGAERMASTLRCPTRLRDDEAAAEFAALGLDAAVVAAYGLILPRAMLEAPRLGCLNVHASLLPRWRGAAPISARSWRATARPGSRSCRWTRGSTPARSCCAEACRSARGTTAASSPTNSPSSAARLIVAALDGLADGRADAAAAAARKA